MSQLSRLRSRSNAVQLVDFVPYRPSTDAGTQLCWEEEFPQPKKPAQVPLLVFFQQNSIAISVNVVLLFLNTALEAGCSITMHSASMVQSYKRLRMLRDGATICSVAFTHVIAMTAELDTYF